MTEMTACGHTGLTFLLVPQHVVKELRQDCGTEKSKLEIVNAVWGPR